MKRRNETQKRIILGLVAFFLAVLMVFGMIAPFLASSTKAPTRTEPPSASVVIQTEAGFASLYKVNRPMPVIIFLENYGPDFKGNLEIRPRTAI